MVAVLYVTPSTFHPLPGTQRWDLADKNSELSKQLAMNLFFLILLLVCTETIAVYFCQEADGAEQWR